MSCYLIRRLAAGVALILALTLITYEVFFLIPVNPACIVVACGPGSNTTDAEIKAADHRLGVDRPVLAQYGSFLWRLVRHGSLGRSWAGGFDVAANLEQVVPATASILLGGSMLLLLLAIPLGAISALHPYGLLDRGILIFSLLGIALHPFVIGLLLRSLFALRLHIAPGQGYCPLRGETSLLAPGAADAATAEPCGGFLDWSYHLYLPWLVFALFFLPLYTRIFRVAVLDTLGEQFIRTARAKGSSELRLLSKHVLRNAMLPILPMLAIDIGAAVTTAIYIETIFNIHGLGTEALTALSGDEGGYDLPTVVGIVFVVAGGVVILNLISDVALVALDPRITGRSGNRSPLQQLRDLPARRRLAVTAAAGAAVAIAVTFFSVDLSRSPSGPPLAVLAAGSHTLPDRWAELAPGGTVSIEIKRIRVGLHGWTVDARVKNQTHLPMSIVRGGGSSKVKPFALVIGGPDRTPEQLVATTFAPPLPTSLAAGASWIGAFGGAQPPPTLAHVHLSFGGFQTQRGFPPYTFVTSRAFVNGK